MILRLTALGSTIIYTSHAGEWGQWSQFGPCLEGKMNRTRLCHSWNTKVVAIRKCRNSKDGWWDIEEDDCELDYGKAKADGDMVLFQRSALILPPLAEIDGRTLKNENEEDSSTSPNPLFQFIQKRTVKRPLAECERHLYTCGPSMLYTITGRYDYTGDWTTFGKPGYPDRPVYQLFDRRSQRHRNLWIGDWFGNDQQHTSWLLTINRIPNADGKFQFYAFHNKTNKGHDQCPAQDESPLPGDWQLGWNKNPARFIAGFVEGIKRGTKPISCGQPANQPNIPGVTSKPISPATTLTKSASDPNARPQDSLRIVGGQKVQKHTFPWQAALFHRDQFCGGILISPHFVITAAHCVAEYKTELSVLLGADDFKVRDDGEQMICIHGAPIVHPNWNPAHPEKGYDIALLRLAWPANITDNVHPLCLDKQTKPAAGTVCVATGWGYTSQESNNRNAPSKLHQIPMLIEDCYWSQQVEALLCAKGSSNGLQNGTYGTTCVGDSGGPLSCMKDGRWELTGIVSFGLGNTKAGITCGWQDTPSVFTKVSSYYDWIHEAMDNEMGTDATWASWSEWSSCENEVQKRTRRCNGKKGYCLGESEESMFCEEVEPVFEGSCSDTPRPCHDRALCTNVPASGRVPAHVKCHCARGWEGNGFYCEQADTKKQTCPWPLTNNNKQSSRGIPYTIRTPKDVVFQEPCFTGAQGTRCKMSCKTPKYTPTVSQLTCLCKRGSCYWYPDRHQRGHRYIGCRDTTPHCKANVDAYVRRRIPILQKYLHKILYRENTMIDRRELTTRHSYTLKPHVNIQPNAIEKTAGKKFSVGTNFVVNTVWNGHVIPSLAAQCHCRGSGRKTRCGYYYRYYKSQTGTPYGKLMRNFPRWNLIDRYANVLNQLRNAIEQEYAHQ